MEQVFNAFDPDPGVYYHVKRLLNPLTRLHSSSFVFLVKGGLLPKFHTHTNSAIWKASAKEQSENTQNKECGI
jgi:hypothetical protein